VISDLDPSGLSDRELDLLETELKRLRDRVAAVRYARVIQREITGETWADFELRLQGAADPETTKRFAQSGDRSWALLVDGAPPPSVQAVERTAEAMVMEGYPEEAVAEHVAATAIARGLQRRISISATARGLTRARRRSRRATS